MQAPIILQRSLILENAHIDKQQVFYYLDIVQGEQEWQSGLCFSHEEAVALKAHITAGRSTVKGWMFELMPQAEAVIKTISLEDILKDTASHSSHRGQS